MEMNLKDTKQCLIGVIDRSKVINELSSTAKELAERTEIELAQIAEINGGEPETAEYWAERESSLRHALRTLAPKIALLADVYVEASGGDELDFF